MNIFANTRLALSTAALMTALALVVAAAYAFLSDTEASTDNTFEAGVIDLLIDNTSYYNGEVSKSTTWTLDNLEGHLFFNFLDVKPGDWGEDTISIHVNNNDAWACFDTTLTSDDDVSSNEPELLAGDVEENPQDSLDGELGENLNFVFWVDDGDNVLEDDEVGEENIIEQGPANQVLDGLSVTLADTLGNLFSEEGGPLVGGNTYYIAKAWCFGELTLTPVAEDAGVNPTVASGITCDGSGLDNTTQTDTLTADVAFSAVQSRNNTSFTCEEPEPTPTQTISCEPENNIFAASAISNSQGTRKNGTPILTDRTDPSDATGPNDSTGAAFDNPVPAGSFYALGFDNGNIVLSFTKPFYNEAGPDLQIYEVTGGTSYPEEIVQVEVSSNGSDWTSLGTVTRDGTIDMGSVASAQYVRLTEASNKALFEPEADGYDLDAVKAFCTEVENQINQPQVDE